MPEFGVGDALGFGVRKIEFGGRTNYFGDRKFDSGGRKFDFGVRKNYLRDRKFDYKGRKNDFAPEAPTANSNYLYEPGYT